MKLRGACLVALLLVAPSVHAQSLQRAPSRGLTVGDLLRKYAKRDAGVRRKVVKLDSTSDTFIFAAAGSVQGAGGTFFRSDVTLFNHRTVAQDVAIVFMAQGVDNSDEPLEVFQLPANTPTMQRDLVGFLEKSGLGTILVAAVDAAGDPDPTAEIDGSSRIWSPQPGSGGTVSQGFPSVAFLDSFGTTTAYAGGLRHDAGFRTNVGIVNFDDAPHTWTIDVNGVSDRRSLSVTVPPFSMRQQAVPNANYGDLVLGIQTSDGGFWWSGYGASVDNTSGDSWSSHASQPGF